MDNKQKLQEILKKYKIEYIKGAFIVFAFVGIFLCFIFPFNIIIIILLLIFIHRYYQQEFNISFKKELINNVLIKTLKEYDLNEANIYYLPSINKNKIKDENNSVFRDYLAKLDYIIEQIYKHIFQKYISNFFLKQFQVPTYPNDFYDDKVQINKIKNNYNIEDIIKLNINKEILIIDVSLEVIIDYIIEYKYIYRNRKQYDSKNNEYKYFSGLLISFPLRNIYIPNPILVFFVKNILNDPINFIKANYVSDKKYENLFNSYLFKYFNHSSISFKINEIYNENEYKILDEDILCYTSNFNEIDKYKTIIDNLIMKYYKENKYYFSFFVIYEDKLYNFLHYEDLNIKNKDLFHVSNFLNIKEDKIKELEQKYQQEFKKILNIIFN
jgi:hypothetical protein